MSTAGALGSASVAQQDIAYPYPPSWFDRLKVWVERLPGPPWLFYLLVGAVLFALLTLTQWQAGAYPIGTINAFHLWFAMEIGYLPAVLHYLDRAALNALAASRPTLNIDGSQYEVLRYQLTTLPARQTNWVSLVLALNVSIVTVIFVPTSPDAIQALQTSAEPVSLALFAFLFGLTWWCLGVLVVHTIHQLRLVGRIYKEYVTINLFDLGPLYAFSGITARTAVAILFMDLLWTVTEPAGFGQGTGIINAIPYAFLGITTFVLPLWGIHNRLVAEKERLLGENGRRSEALVRQLHQEIGEGNFSHASAIKDVVTTLDLQHKALAQIPTWPWAPDTVRSVITAVLLPIGLFLLQSVLSRLLGTG